MDPHVKTYLESYLLETSIHGCRHLVKERDRKKSFLWAVIIAISFAASGYLVGYSVNYRSQNPVATTTNFVSIQELPFPAVTIGAETLSVEDGRITRRFHHEILENLEFDCANPRSPANATQRCLQNSRALRETLRKPILDFIGKIHRSYLAYMEDTEKRTVLVEFMVSEGLCHFLRSHGGGDVMEVFLDFEKQNKWQDMVEVLADNFRTPLGTTIKALLDMNKNYPQPEVNITYTSDNYFEVCRKFLFYNVTDKARAALMTLMELERNSVLPFRWAKALGVVPEMFFPYTIDEMTKYLYESNELLMESTELAYTDLLDYMAYPHPLRINGSRLKETCTKNKNEDSVRPSPMCANVDHYGEACCELEKGAVKHYRQILNVLKYSKEAAVPFQLEKGDIESVMNALTEIIPSRYSVKATSENSMTHFEPAILACKFGKHTEPMKRSCKHFYHSFTSDGLGLTFNQAPFFQLFKKSSWSAEFFEELVAREGTEERGEPAKPEFNGPGFSFKFLLNISTKQVQPRRNFRRVRLSDDSRSSRSVALHTPYAVPNLAGDVLEVSGGTHYTILVTPEVIRNNGDLEDLDVARSECIARNEDDDMKIFNLYERDNCLFECQLNVAVRKCGCIPWDYPRMNDSVPICYEGKAMDCFDIAIGNVIDPTNCPHCLWNCNMITYSHNVLIKPLSESHLCPNTYLGDLTEVQDTIWHAISNPLEKFQYLNTIDDSDKSDGNMIWYKPYEKQVCDKAVRENIAIVDVHIAPAMATRITRTPRTTSAEQLAQFGGVIALFTGMSILSVFELVMWCTKIPKIVKKSLESKQGKIGQAGNGAAKKEIVVVETLDEEVNKEDEDEYDEAKDAVRENEAFRDVVKELTKEDLVDDALKEENSKDDELS